MRWGAAVRYGLVRTPVRWRRVRLGRILILAPGDGPLQHLEQPLGIEIELARAELKCLATGQHGQACGQLVGTGHAGPFDQDGNNANTPRQGSFDLYPDEVVWV